MVVPGLVSFSPMGTESDGPELSPWFWELLESSNRTLRSLCRKLEQLPKDELRNYQRQYDEVKEFVNPHYCEEFWPYLTDGYSEDDCDDFSAWVVMRGRDFYEQVRADPASLPRYVALFAEVERKVAGSPRWDTSVDRAE